MPAILGLGVLTVAAWLEWGGRAARDPAPPPRFAGLTRLENLTYDWRVGLAANHPPLTDKTPVALLTNQVNTNLALVFVDESQLRELNAGPGRYQWPWPRFLHGELVRALRGHGARAIAFDIAFIDEERDYAENRRDLPGAGPVTSDAFFAGVLSNSTDVILGVPLDQAVPASATARTPLRFPTDTIRQANPRYGHALAATDSEVDGVHRRIRPFYDDPVVGRVWQLGIMLAATAMGADLNSAVFEPGLGLRFRLADGTERVVPLDEQGRMLLDWRFNAASVMAEAGFFANRQFAILDVLGPPYSTNGPLNSSELSNSVVLVASTGIGANIADKGPSPVRARDWQPLIHLNVANSLLLGRFHTPHTRTQEFLLTALMTTVSTLLAWRVRLLPGVVSLAGLLLAYLAVAVWLFLERRYWLPVAMPLALGGGVTFGLVALWRVLVEERQMRRLKRFFARVVSPKILDLLEGDQLPATGVLREVTILFADIRGFTRFTDKRHSQTEFVLRSKADPAQDPQRIKGIVAEETLATVNLYLGAIAHVVKQHDGTIDKFIGDSVMAFWGAPVEEPRHAVAALKAAIAIQREVHRLNTERQQENERRAAQTGSRAAAGLPALPELPILEIGVALHTGLVTAGFIMGTDEQISNYTVFGREVNIAARLESLAPPSRIILSETTRRAALRDDLEVAALCQAKGESQLRGIAEQILVHEVRWKMPPAPRHD